MNDILDNDLSPWEGGEGPEELLFDDIEICPIDEHLTCGVSSEFSII